MSERKEPGADRENRLGEAVAWYYEAAEIGSPPKPADFLARYPDLRSELESFLADKEAFNRFAGPRPDPDATLPPAPNPETAHFTPASDQTATLPPSSLKAVSDGPLGTVRYFGDYELQAEIARGGMGVVFRARQVSLNREVALKMILTGQLASAADVARFHSEAESAANLDHPNILPIYEIGEHLGQHYFSMKLISGGSLAGKVAELVKDPKAAVALLVKVCRAVDFAHRRGILHRDLKPGNILLDADGTPYVTDFGLAKKVEGDSNLTQSGAIVGTPSYMAPEQARAEKGLTTGVDVYALGAILFELLTGTPPFRGPTVLDTILQVLEKDAVDPRLVNPKVDRDLSMIALKCLEKEPGKRDESAAALADDLERWLRGEPTLARPPSLAEQAWRWVRRNALAATATLILGLAWGLSASLGLLAAKTGNNQILLPLGISWINPVVWLFVVIERPPVRVATIIVGAVLTLGIGPFVCLAARPRTTRSALGAAATVGLLAILVSFTFLGTGYVALLSYVTSEFNLHPVQHVEYDATMSPEEENYLVQYLPPELQPADAPGRLPALQTIRRKAAQTNIINVAIIVGLIFFFVVGVFLMTLSLLGTWAADYLNRSGRGLIARLTCYMEMYVPTMLLVLWFLVTIMLVIVTSSKNVIGGPPWTIIALIGGFFWGLVTLAYIGVIRRWHGLIRVGLYIVYAGLAAGTVWLVS